MSIREKEQRRERQELRMTITLFSIFLAFVLCTLPPMLILLIGEKSVYNWSPLYCDSSLDPGGKKFPEWHIPLYMFGWAFGVVNPIIYICFNKTYREAYKTTLQEMLKSLATLTRRTAPTG